MDYGYTLQWVASEVETPVNTLRDWKRRGLFEGTTWDRRGLYAQDFVDRARAINRVRQLWPYGPAENWRDRLLQEPDDEA